MFVSQFTIYVNRSPQLATLCKLQCLHIILPVETTIKMLIRRASACIALLSFTNYVNLPLLDDCSWAIGWGLPFCIILLIFAKFQIKLTCFFFTYCQNTCNSTLLWTVRLSKDHLFLITVPTDKVLDLLFTQMNSSMHNFAIWILCFADFVISALIKG